MKKVHYIILTVFFFLLIISTAVAIYWPSIVPVDSANDNPADNNTTATTEIETTNNTPQYRCPLDGLATSIDKSTRRPLAIMIENHPDARPQSSLTKACLVYETVAEGGVTRFMALFLHNDAGAIGPVRSGREYFADISKQYEAIFTHCGGPAALAGLLQSYNVADMDEFKNQDTFWRINGRKAPHNLYTSTERLYKRAAALDYTQDVFYQKPNFKDDNEVMIRPQNASVDISFSRPEFAVHYEYDRRSNTYKRSMAGKPHIDGVFNTQISPSNIIIQYAPISSIANDPKGRMQVSLVGSGKSIVFQDGKAIQGSWTRTSLTDLTRYYDENGAEIKFNRGQTWIELVDETKMSIGFK